MKKHFIIKVIVAVFVLMPMFFSTAHASEIEDKFDVDTQIEASGVNELFSYLPDETKESLDEAGISSVNQETFTNIIIPNMLNSFINITQEEMKSPFAAIGIILGVLIIVSLVQSSEHSLGSQLAPSFGNVISAAIGMTVIIPIIGLVDDITSIVDSACIFTEAFAPVFIGTLIAGGQTASAAGYSSFLFGAIEITTVCIDELIVPILKVFLAISCICAMSQNVKLDSFIEFIEKNSKWILSFLAVILSGILSISGIISASADNLASRTAKFIISGSVPIVGGAVSDAYLSIKGGMALLRNSVGAFGIIAVVYIYLPIIIRTLLWNFAIQIGLVTCEVLKLDTVNKLLKSISGMLSMMFGILVFSLFVLTLAGIVIILQNNA